MIYLVHEGEYEDAYIYAALEGPELAESVTALFHRHLGIEPEPGEACPHPATPDEVEAWREHMRDRRSEWNKQYHAALLKAGIDRGREMKGLVGWLAQQPGFRVVEFTDVWL